MSEYEYPSDEDLEAIAAWDATAAADRRAWFGFIRSVWWMPEWGWTVESGVDDEVIPGRKVTRYRISTGGWSGNESIVAAMERNFMGWALSWVSSRRGGHFVFEIPEEA